MKTLLFIAVLFLGHSALGQCRIDSKVYQKFDSLFNLQPKDIQEKRYIEDLDDGFALLLNFKEDTLNIKEFTPRITDKSIKIVLINPETGEELPDPVKDTTRHNPWFACKAIYLKDTLGIGSFFGLFSGLGFSIKIVGDKTFGDLFEYESGNNIYRHRLADQKSSQIQVKALADDVTLSSIPKNIGDVVYGKATLVTEPFYLDDAEFKNGYIHKRYTITYLFTCKLTDDKEK